MYVCASSLCRFFSSNTDEGSNQLPNFEPPDALLEADLLEVQAHTLIGTQGNIGTRMHTLALLSRCDHLTPSIDLHA